MLLKQHAMRRAWPQLHAKRSHGKKLLHLQAHPKIVGGPIEPAFFLSNESQENNRNECAPKPKRSGV
jgi:hypothetical protein